LIIRGALKRFFAPVICVTRVRRSATIRLHAGAT
jgi:hypothetical protein